MKAWQETTLKRVASKIDYGYTASATEINTGAQFLRITDIVPRSIDWSSVPFCEISEGDYEKSRLSQGDIVIARTGATVGYAKQIGANPPDAVFASYLVRVKLKDGVSSKFVGLLVESNNYKNYINTIAGGSAQPNANAQDLSSYPFFLPPKPVQHRIAAILSAYDDLIENNRRRIALLEQMAEELYREWFVRMRFPGHDKVKKAKGVPEGWVTKPLPELSDITYGYAFDGARFNADGHGRPIIRIRNIPDSSTSDYTDEVVNDKYIVHHGDLLVGMDGEFHINHWYGEESYLVQRVCRIKAKSPVLEGYLFHAIRAPIKHFESILLGATVGHLGAMHLKSIKLIEPPESMHPQLEMLNDLHRQKLLLGKTVRNLSKKRDLLLPRLISGKLSVENLDIQFPPGMEEAAHAA